MKRKKLTAAILLSSALVISCCTTSSSNLQPSSIQPSFEDGNFEEQLDSNTISVGTQVNFEIPRLGYYLGFEIPEIVSTDEKSIDIFVHLARAKHINYFDIDSKIIYRDEFDNYDFYVKIWVKGKTEETLSKIPVNPYDFVDSDKYLATFSQEDETICGDETTYLIYQNTAKAEVDFSKIVDASDDSEYARLYVYLIACEKSSGIEYNVGDANSGARFKKTANSTEIVFC